MAAPTVKARSAAPARPQTASTGLVPFTRASRQKTMSAFNVTSTLAATPVVLAPIEVPPGGFLRFIEIEVTGTTSGNSAAVAFANDAPYNVLQQLSMVNAAGDSIIVPVGGHRLAMMNKYFLWGQDSPNCDPAAGLEFSKTTGSGATGGSFKFILRIPAEICQRDAFCALPNMASNKQYMLNIILNSISALYTTAPTTAPSVNITGTMYYWTQPNSSNAAGVQQATQPQGNGSVNLVRYESIVVNGGDHLFQLHNTGNVIRGLMFVLTNSSGARDDTDWPAIAQILLNNDTLFYLTQDQLLADMQEYWGYTGTSKDVAGGLDTGVYVLPYLNNGRGKQTSDGPRDQYLPTLDSTLLQIRGTSFGAGASTLEVYTNEIKPVSAAALYAPNVS